MPLIQNDRAAYRVLNPYGFYSDNDHLYQEGDEIYFDGTPNEMLEPLNQLARDRLNAHLEQLDNYGKAAAEKLGRSYAGRPRSLDGGLELASALLNEQKSILGNKNKQSTTEEIEREPVPETPRRGRQKRVLSV